MDTSKQSCSGFCLASCSVILLSETGQCNHHLQFGHHAPNSGAFFCYKKSLQNKPCLHTTNALYLISRCFLELYFSQFCAFIHLYMNVPMCVGAWSISFTAICSFTSKGVTVQCVMAVTRWYFHQSPLLQLGRKRWKRRRKKHPNEPWQKVLHYKTKHISLMHSVLTGKPENKL